MKLIIIHFHENSLKLYDVINGNHPKKTDFLLSMHLAMIRARDKSWFIKK